MKLRRLVIGDIHGAARALRQVFERSKFDPEHDELIVLGDVCDGWPETKEVLDILCTVKEIVPIAGNHDIWFLDWAGTGIAKPEWVHQGGAATIASYDGDARNIPTAHKSYLNALVTHHWADEALEDGAFFVHGGFPRLQPWSAETLSWDRSMWEEAKEGPIVRWAITEADRVFIGHTQTENPDGPEIRHNVWNLDQGAGWDGKLTLMDIDNEEHWSSDIVASLYPEHKGRGDMRFRRVESLYMPE